MVDYYDAERIAISQGRSVADVQCEMHAKEVALETMSAKFAVLQNQKDRVAREQAKIEQAAADLVAASDIWDKLLIRYHDTKRKLVVGGQQLEQIQAEADGRREFLHQRFWGETFGPEAYPGRAIELFGAVAGAERAIKDFPDWRAGVQSELTTIETEIVKFAKEYDLNEKLPADLCKPRN